MLHLDPASPAHAMLGKTWTPAKGAALNRQLRLNRPVPVQFILWIRGVLAAGGVGAVIRQSLPPTLELLALAILLSGLASVIIAGVETRHAGTLLDALLGSITGLLSAIPGFFMGTFLLYSLTIRLTWFFASGFAGPQASWASWVWHEVLPVATLSLTAMGPWIRQLRACAGEVLQSEFVRTARAKGLPESRVIERHVLRNALPPFLTQVGLSFSVMINTIIAIEVIFGIQGAGMALIGALNSFFFAQATTVAFVGVSHLAGSLLADLRIHYR